MGRKLGIDLGTTYSCVSYVDETGVTRIIDPIEGGGYTTPSVVYFDPDGTNVVVGATARTEGALNPENVVERVKNYMGDPNYTLFINGNQYSPAAVSSIILKKLINDAEEHFGGEEIEGVVITCPAYFGDHERDATRLAGENVTLRNGEKLKVFQLLDEPVAAALAYGNNCHEDMSKQILIYDLGGGTFDCTVMKIDFVGGDRKMEVITTHGNHQLGGKDWDAAIAEYVRNEFCNATGEDPDEMANDPEQNQWFSENIEKAKITLSRKDTVSLTPNYNGNKSKVELTRQIFDEQTSSLLNQTTMLIDEMLALKGMSMADIDEIVLVGGSTRMPQVTEKLKNEYGKPISSFEPDKAVAMGAALVASGMGYSADKAAAGATSSTGAGDVDVGGAIVVEGIPGETTTIIVKCTKSYGLVASRYDSDEEFIANIIFKDTEKPAEQTRRFGTSVANQTGLNLRVYENSSLEKDVTFEESKQLYEACVVDLTPGLPKGAPIEITFKLDASGVFSIVALDVTNNISKEVVPVKIGAEATTTGMDFAADAVLN